MRVAINPFNSGIGQMLPALFVGKLRFLLGRHFTRFEHVDQLLHQVQPVVQISDVADDGQIKLASGFISAAVTSVAVFFEERADRGCERICDVFGGDLRPQQRQCQQHNEEQNKLRWQVSHEPILCEQGRNLNLNCRNWDPRDLRELLI